MPPPGLVTRGMRTTFVNASGSGITFGAGSEDLLDALRQWLALQSPLASAVAGGITLDEAETGATGPYLVLKEMGERLIRSSSSSKIYSRVVSFKFYNESAALAGQAGDQLKALLKITSFDFTGGHAYRPVLENRKHGKAPGYAKNNKYRHFQQSEYRFRVREAVTNGA